MSKESMRDFIQKYGLCVLSTSSKSGKTESAVMSVVVKPDFKILISTETTTRKYKNILENNQVSLVVGGLNNDPTLQIDGKIRELAKDEGEKAKKFILSVNPSLEPYFQSPEIRFFEIHPVWARFCDFSKDPILKETITEF